MRRVVEADTHSLTLRLAGTFKPTDQLYRRAEDARRLNLRLLERFQEAGAVRGDLVSDDLSFLFEQLASVRSEDEQRTWELRDRYLTLVLDALRSSSGGPLPGPAPAWDEVRGRWQRTEAGPLVGLVLRLQRRPHRPPR